MDDTAFERRLRDELSAAADGLGDGAGVGVESGADAARPAAGYLRKVDRRRRRATAVAVGLPLVAAVAVLAAVVGAVRWGDDDTRHDAIAVRAADQPAGPPAARRVLESADAVVVDILGGLRKPTVTALDDGFMVWGPGDAGSNTGAIHRESDGSWHQVPNGPLSPRKGAATVWTGDEVVVAGGQPTTGSELLRDVAAFDPAVGRWRSLPELPEGREDATAVSTAGRIVVAGGRSPTEPSTSTVLVGDGRTAWAEVDVGFPAVGGVVVGDRVVVFGLDDDENEQAPLELTLVDPVTRAVTPLPDLGPAEWVDTSYIADVAVGVDGDQVVAVLGGSGEHALQSLGLSARTWSEPLRLRSDGNFLGPERMAGRVAGVVVMDGAMPWVITRHGAYEIDPDDGRVHRLGELDERCAGHLTVDNATTFAVGPDSTMLWIDRTCDGAAGLAGQEGALLLSLGTGRG